MTELTAGAMAPDFELPRDGGGTLRLSALRGKRVVLFFYPKDDTSACTTEAVDFSALKRAFAQAGATIIGISPDSPKKHDKFKARHGISVDLASDQAKEAAEAYGVWGEKTMFGRKYMGVIRSTFLIAPDGRIERAWRKVSVPGHAQEVLEAAREARQLSP
jgi:peroxiredoxin Q/BCP